MSKLEKVVTNLNGMFQGYITENGVKVEGSDREFATKIAIGSALGRIMKTMAETDTTAAVETPNVETPNVETPNVETPNVEPQEEEPVISMDTASGDDSTVIADIKNGEIVGIEVLTETPAVETPAVETPAAETPAVKEQKMVAPIAKPSTRAEQADAYIRRLRARTTEVLEINGIKVNVIESNWASSLKYRHKAVEYSIEIISPTEIFMSRTIDPALGVSYFETHAPKLTEWIGEGLTLADTGHTIHNIEKLKFTQLIWSFASYKIMGLN